MIRVGDLKWTRWSTGPSNHAVIPGTRWNVIKKTAGYVVFSVLDPGFIVEQRYLEDDVSLQCWLSMLGEQQ